MDESVCENTEETDHSLVENLLQSPYQKLGVSSNSSQNIAEKLKEDSSIEGQQLPPSYGEAVSVMPYSSMGSDEQNKEIYSLNADNDQVIPMPSGSSQVVTLFPMSGSAISVSKTAQAPNQQSFKMSSSSTNFTSSSSPVSQTGNINKPISEVNSNAVNKQLANAKKIENSNISSILCVASSSSAPLPTSRSSEVFIKTSSGHYTVFACRAGEIKAQQNSNSTISYTKPKAQIKSTRSMQALHLAAQTIISGSCEISPSQQPVKEIMSEEHSCHEVGNLTNPNMLQVESGTQDQQEQSGSAVGGHKIITMAGGSEMDGEGNVLQGDHQLMKVQEGHSMIQVEGQNLLQEAEADSMQEARHNFMQEGHHVVELGEQIIQMDDEQTQQHLSQKQLMQMNQEHLVEDGSSHQMVEVDGQQVVLLSGQLDIKYQQEQLQEQEQQMLQHSQNLHSCSIVRENVEHFRTADNGTVLDGVEETVVSTELHTQQTLEEEGMGGEEVIDSVEVELSSQNELELKQGQLHSRQHLFRALLDDDEENEGLSEQLVNVQTDDDGRMYQDDQEGEALNLESCVEQIWSEEQLLKLIVAVTSKKGWRNMDNLASFYQDLLPAVDPEGQLSWQALQHKWLQLYSTYSALLNQEEFSLPSSATGSALYAALRNADLQKPNEGELDSDGEASEHVKNGKKVRSADQGVTLTRRKSPEFLWSTEITRRFINLRADMHGAIAQKGHTAVYQEILDQLGVADRVTVMMARKKWNYLVNRYQDECASGGARRWVMMTDMAQVMDRFAGLDTSKLKSRASPEFLWPDELTIKFIDLRVARNEEFAKLGIQNTYNKILHELGLDHILTPHHLRKKWNYLVGKHKEISSSSSISLHTGNNGTTLEFPHQWPFYDRMTAAITALSSSSATDGNLSSTAANATAGHPTTSGSTTKSEHLWTRNSVLRFIKLRAARSQDTKNLNALYASILSELNLSDTMRPHQARKKWNYLWNKYQELSQVGVSDFLRQSWPYYTAMKAAAAALPLMPSVGFQEQLPKDIRKTEEEVDDSRTLFKKPRVYTCFICSASSRQLSDYYMFENDQRLLHTQKTVLELVSHLIGKKLSSVEQTTMLCTRCTMLVNEADSVINRQEKIKQEARSLYELKLSRTQATSDDQRNVFDVILSATGDLESCSSPPAVEIEVDSMSPSVEDEGVEAKSEVKSSIITYSKRGRKRKSTIFNDAIQKCVKVEPTEDGSVTSFECDIDFEDQFENERPKRKVVTGRGRGRGRGRRGRGRGRGRPTIRSTLIGRGLDGQYPTNNKRGTTFFKGLKIYNCSECQEEFKKYTDLVTHRKEIHTVIDNTPLEVEETVLDSGIITYFNKDKANSMDTSHPCKDCDKVFLRKDDLSYHYELSHTDGKGRAKAAFKNKSYACEECGDTFLFKYKLKLHINNKHLNDAGTSANDFTCGDCGSKLGSLPGLTFHMRKHHSKVLNYKKSTDYLCSDCGFMAPSSKKLREHQEAHCGFAAKEQVQCEICGKTVLKVSLKMHKIKMHSEFKEQCDRCGERYATKTDLLRHFNVVHLKILLYSCKHCDEKFATSDALRYHRVKIHEKPSFFCHICNKSYKRVGELNTHVKRVHNDRRKAEVCTYCGKEYYDRSGLRNHLVSKHNVAQELTYSESYLRKKRVDGLPLAKHFEKRMTSQEDTKHEMEIISAHQLEEMMQSGHTISTAHQHQHPEHLHQQQQQHVIVAQHQQVDLGHHGGIPPQQHHLEVVHHQHHQEHHHHHHHHQQQQQQQVMVDEAAVAARSLASYNTHGAGGDGGHEDDSSLVVTEITEDSASEQQIIIDHMGNIIHHPNMQVTSGGQRVVVQQPAAAAGVHHHSIVQQHHGHHPVASQQQDHHTQGVVQQHLTPVANSSAVPHHVHHPATAVGRMGVIYQVNGHPHATNGAHNHINM